MCRCQLYFVALAITSPSESGYWRTCSEDGLYGHSASVVCDSGNPPAGVEERKIAEFISNFATRSEGSMGSSRIALRNGCCVNHDACQGRCQIGLPRSGGRRALRQPTWFSSSHECRSRLGCGRVGIHIVHSSSGGASKDRISLSRTSENA